MFVGVPTTRPRRSGCATCYLQRYARSTVEHYQFADVRFADIEGYEYYAGLARNIEKHGLDKFNGFLADLQVWGTPDQVTEKLLDYVGARTPAPCWRRSPTAACRPTWRRPTTTCSPREVLPALHAHDVGGDIGVTHDSLAASPA